MRAEARGRHRDMKIRSFALRNAKEILRDPLTFIFGLGFPIVILLLLTAIQTNVPVDLFELETLTPGVAVFGLSFITLFSATLISRDKKSALLMRLFTTPMRACDFILGYTLPVFPIAFAQIALCYAAAAALGLKITAGVVLSVLYLIPVSLFFIFSGLLFGSLFNDKQVGGICGALFTNLTAWLSGTWFDLEIVGGAFKTVCYCFPFVHATEACRKIIASYGDILINTMVVSAYAVAVACSSIAAFTCKMKEK